MYKLLRIILFSCIFIKCLIDHNHRIMKSIVSSLLLLIIFLLVIIIIFSGDVVLKNLQLKQSALKELDLPVQLVYGQLGKLVLKIPWKNLYSLPVEADVEDLYLLVAPNSAVNYNADKQFKLELDTKKHELLKVEEAKKRELEKDKPKADKSFTEKLVAQIINNVQIRIRNVHIRYEDRSTSVIPFAFGITLGGLEVHTTNIDWEKAFVSETLSRIFKVAKLDGLAVYMNCNTRMFQSRPVDDFTQLFQDSIASSDTRPENYTYGMSNIIELVDVIGNDCTFFFYFSTWTNYISY